MPHATDSRSRSNAQSEASLTRAVAAAAIASPATPIPSPRKSRPGRSYNATEYAITTVGSRPPKNNTVGETNTSCTRAAATITASAGVGARRRQATGAV